MDVRLRGLLRYHPERFDGQAERFGFKLALLQADETPTVLHRYVAVTRPLAEVARAERAVPRSGSGISSPQVVGIPVDGRRT
ncbi:MAG: hypothetical protein U0871_05055 [Gemmataceae bacterium]